jgi:HK97 gp10 family phage protein
VIHLRLDMLGFAEMDANLMQLADNVRGDALKDAALEAVEPVRAMAEQLAPFEGGSHRRAHGPHVRESIVADVRMSDANGVDVDVGPSAASKTAWRARWIEFGTKAHELKEHFTAMKVRLRVRRSTAAASRGEFQVAEGRRRKVTGIHPGATERPFLRPALDENSDTVLEKFAEALRNRLFLIKNGLAGVKEVV